MKIMEIMEIIFWLLLGFPVGEFGAIKALKHLNTN